MTLWAAPAHAVPDGTGNDLFIGNVGIGSLAPVVKLDVNGTVRAWNYVCTQPYCLDADNISFVDGASLGYPSVAIALDHLLSSNPLNFTNFWSNYYNVQVGDPIVNPIFYWSYNNP
ncbi:MAG: hypothetical protein HQL14_04390, partial [Candidatus Omnitrophica bacterium]|nr:hypothetical protein [Candidatus Omnitrophota bacterium]